ncbi:MAG: polysaccharide deacetylase family protein, partial [Acidobacteriota bacterium]|nr:polysaccharide deacetylase family protein [Acidobacteriota bacterium]
AGPSTRLMDKRLIFAGASAAVALGAGAWAAVYYATYAVRSQLLGETVWRGDAGRNAVALTFDDGPSQDTVAILDLLRERDLKATFFMIGEAVERLPRVARRVAEEGHELGNHSYSHPIYLFRSAAETARQLERAQVVIERATGVRPLLARPPCGVRTRAYFRAARRLGLRTVQWDSTGHDWTRAGARDIAARVLEEARAGSIILLHDGDSAGREDRRRTVESLPHIIDGLAARGLRVAPLAEVVGGFESPNPRPHQSINLQPTPRGADREQNVLRAAAGARADS